MTVGGVDKKVMWTSFVFAVGGLLAPNFSRWVLRVATLNLSFIGASSNASDAAVYVCGFGAETDRWLVWFRRQ